MLGAQDVKKIEIEQNNNSEVSKPTEVAGENQTISNDFVPRDLAINKVAELFGLTTSDIGKYSPELNRVVDYAKQVGAKTLEDVMFYVRSLSDSLANNMQEKKLKTVSRYLFLLSDRQKLEQDIERMKQ
jgi:hypothetical protein